VFSGNVWLSLVPIFINQVFVQFLYACFKKCRGRMMKLAKSLGRTGVRVKMFDEQVQESENDVSSLAWSFLNVQALKFHLVGKLPTMTGETELPDGQVGFLASEWRGGRGG